MDVNECVLLAGRAVLDMVEQEWQPLSAGELEQRLDQAMEEHLEDELLAKAKNQSPPTIYVQLLQSQASANHAVPQSSTHEEESAEPRAPQQPADSVAVKVPVREQDRPENAFTRHHIHNIHVYVISVGFCSYFRL